MEDSDLREIARLIQEGCTRGLLDPEDGRHISWELKIEEWEDSEDGS